MIDFFLFKSFIAHRLIKVLYYFVLVLLFLGYIGMTAIAFLDDTMAGLIALGVGFLVMIFYALILRVSAEMMVVIFEIHDELQSINENVSAGASSQGQNRSLPAQGQHSQPAQQPQRQHHGQQHGGGSFHHQ